MKRLVVVLLLVSGGARFRPGRVGAPVEDHVQPDEPGREVARHGGRLHRDRRRRHRGHRQPGRSRPPLVGRGGDLGEEVGRRHRPRHRALDGVGEPTRTPYPPVHGVNSDISARASGVEFAGVVLPVSRRFVAAVSFAENLRFEGDPGEDGYAYIELRDNRSGGTTRRDFLFEFREYGAVSLRNRLLGLSAAYRATDRLRIGAGVTLNRMELDLLGDAGGAHRIVNRNYTPTHDRDDHDDRGDPGPRPEHARLRRGCSRRSRAGRQADRGRGLPADGEGDGNARDRGRRPGAARRAGDAVVLGPRAAGRRRGTGGASVSRAHRRRRSPVDRLRGLHRPVPSRSSPTRACAGPFPGIPVGPLLAELTPPDDVIVPRIGIEYVASTADLLLAFRLGYHREPARGVTANLSAYDSDGWPTTSTTRRTPRA